MPKLNAVLMAVFATAVIVALAVLTLRPTPAAELDSAQVQKLLRKLGDADPDLRREGEEGLRRMGPAAHEPLRQASKSSDRKLAERASKLLLELQPSTAPSEPVSAPTE